MAARQRIVRIRRDYNQWVANQTLEDYALRFTAKAARRWSPLRVANTALGGISFLALEAFGGSVTIGYGFANAVPAILAASVLILLTALPISFYAARDGVDIDLLTRGAGFGYIGSTVTSLIYASFTFIFFAVEAVILAGMLQTCFGLPPWLGYILCSVAVVPLATFGITFISRIQLWSQPLWVLLQLLPFTVVGLTAARSWNTWTSFPGTAPGADGGFHLVLFGAAASVVFSLVAQVGEQVDYLRFLPARIPGRSHAGWWAAMLAGGPGWIVIGALKLLAGSFLASLAVAEGIAPVLAREPNVMYEMAFRHVVQSPTGALALAACFVVISQLKINLTNAYAGSIGWSNFFSRLTHSHPGRVVWLVFNIAIALLLMELGIYQTIEHTLVLYCSVAAAWVGALVADLVVNKPLGYSPAHIEFKRAHLYDINPVGCGAMVIAAAAATLAYGGLAGTAVQAFTPFVAFVAAFLSAPLIAWATDGRYYLARKPRAHWGRQSTIVCSLCEHPFEPEDMAFCPAYAGPICSLCCSLDARCHDACKPHARFSQQILGAVEGWSSPAVRARLAGPLGRWAGMVTLLDTLIGLVLVGIYSHMASSIPGERGAMAHALWTTFLILQPVIGVLAWLLTLGQESRRVAQQETQRQTDLLLQEIAAHERTDADLQKAKEAAEAANLAKSRYVVGISHELRSPLNAILGYAQLMEGDPGISAHRREHIKIIRHSGDHMAGLIEGLLDVSKIEAGRIEIYRDQVRLGEFLKQLADMFRLQAEARGIGFAFATPGRMPEVVFTDERRLRQILINLLSNAVKFTNSGEVRFTLRWRSAVAEFEVFDTGIGIEAGDLDRIFEPFQRVDAGRNLATPGIGLGLTITKLLTQIMGGELTVASTLGQGSRFTVRLHLSEVLHPHKPAPIESRILGYAGRRLTVLVADDDKVHRGLLQDLLSPLGFILFTAPDGDACVQMAAECRPDLLLVDVSMPGLNGWRVSERLRRDGFDKLKIIVVSANAGELARPPGRTRFHDDVMAKPIGLANLLSRIRTVLQLEWTAPDQPEDASDDTGPTTVLDPADTQALIELGSIGYVRAIHARLDQIEQEAPGHARTVARLRKLVSQFQIKAFMDALGPGKAGS
ncbi:MAG: hybrid sensor histidine kinase/response regulator [Acetobacteraceae bacterium]|nr:hybrid sensor histidine kinase/response regulator [Acetobacteraceae bacterium]